MHDDLEYGDYRNPTADKLRKMLKKRLKALRGRNDSPDVDTCEAIAEVKYWQDVLDPEADPTIAEESDDPDEDEDL